MHHPNSKPAPLLRLILTALVCLVLAGCDQKALVRRFTPEADDKLARKFITDIIDSNVDAAMPLLAVHFQDATGRKGVDELVALFHGGKIETIETIGAVTNIAYHSGKKQRDVRLSYQLRLTTGWYAGTVIITDDEAGVKIATARFNSISDSLENVNSFNLRNKGVANYLFLAASLVIPLFCLASLVICARSPIKRKWLWVVFVSLGFITFRLNWTTGEIGFQALSFLLFGASAFKSGLYAPWILSFAIPIGAAVFLIKRTSLIAQNTAKTTPEAPTTIGP